MIVRFSSLYHNEMLPVIKKYIHFFNVQNGYDSEISLLSIPWSILRNYFKKKSSACTNKQEELKLNQTLAELLNALYALCACKYRTKGQKLHNISSHKGWSKFISTAK